MKPPDAPALFDRDLWREAQSQGLRLPLTVALTAAASGCLVAQAHLLSRTVARVFLFEASLVDVQPLLGWLALVILLRAVLVTLAEGIARQLAIGVKSSLRGRLFRAFQLLGPAFLQRERSGELSNTLTEGIESLDAYYSQYLPQLVISILAPLTILLAVVSGDPLSAAILLVTAPLVPLFMVLIGQGTQRVTQKHWQMLSHMSAHFLDAIQGLPTLKALGQSRSQVARVARISKQYGDATMRVLRVTFISSLVLELVATLSVAVIAVGTGLRLLQGQLGFADALFVLILAPEFYLPLRMLGARFHAGMEGVSAARRVFELLDRAALRTTNKMPLQNPRPHIEPIHFRHVSFAYDDGERPALHDVSLSVEPGKHLAIAGSSGAGKSTIVQLLLGFLNPQDGEVCVGTTLLAEVESGTWLEQVAWVPQLPHLFNDTIAANIRLGCPRASDDAVLAAARQANLHDFIAHLPEGYETIVGEHGARLSGGEARRLALARAFLKNAPLLILDEPTTGLDALNQRLVREAISRFARGRTVVTITHHLHALPDVDRVVVLQEGRVIAEGPPSELLSDNGNYPEPPGRVRFETAPYPTSPPGTAEAADFEQRRTHALLAGPDTATEYGTPMSTGRATVQLIRQLGGHWRCISVSLLLGLLAIGSTVGLLGTSALLISMAALQPSIASLGVPIVGVRFFGLSRGTFRYLERLATHSVTFRLLAQLRTWTFAALEPLVPARLLGTGSGELLANLVSDVSTLEQFYVRAVSPPLIAFVVTCAVTGFMLLFHWELALILIASLALGGAVLPMFVRFASRRRTQRYVTSRAALGAHLIDALQGMADLAAFGQLAACASRLEQVIEDLAAAHKRLAWIAAIQEGLSTLLSNFAAWLVLAIAIPLVADGKFDGVYLATVVMVTLAAFEAVHPLSQAVQHVEKSLEAARRLFALAQRAPAVADPPAPKIAPQKPNLALCKVTFRYSPEERPALQDIDIDLPMGKRLAIVGPSGAGKTTLLNLLLRFWNYEQGQILLNGVSLRDYSADSVRALFNVIAQNTHLFNASIFDNIRLAHPNASRAEIVAAARAAQIHDFIMSLPQGYETMIGERGLKLSGGQRQRLAMARALVRPAPILLLDEPTANLDNTTERALLRAVYQRADDRTTILIGHRLLFMEFFDEIVVLNEGKLVERGSHSSLLKAKGLYSRLWRLQHREPATNGSASSYQRYEPRSTADRSGCGKVEQFSI